MSTEYGQRIEVIPESVSTRSLGSYDVADSQGNITVVSVEEHIHLTSADPLRAVSYSFDRQPAGKFQPPKLWSALALASGGFLIALFVANILNPKIDLGAPLWVYYSLAAWFFFVSTAIQFRKVGQFILLGASGKLIAEVESAYGKAPLIDFPEGKIAQTQNGVSVALHQLPPSSRNLIPAPLDGLDG